MAPEMLTDPRWSLLNPTLEDVMVYVIDLCRRVPESGYYKNVVEDRLRAGSLVAHPCNRSRSIGRVQVSGAVRTQRPPVTRVIASLLGVPIGVPPGDQLGVPIRALPPARTEVPA